MINRIKNIKNLTKIFFQNSFETPYLINKQNNKSNKKSFTMWLLIIVMILSVFLSDSLIKVLISINQATLFLNFMFLILTIILIFRIVLVSMNNYYFSKDIELILPLPIKPVDLLIAKLNSIIINTYFFELIFMFFPLILYGLYTSMGLVFFLYEFIILLVFPVLPALIISIIMMLLIKLSKFIKNKDIFQVVIIFAFSAFIIFMAFNLIANVNMNNKTEVEELNIINEFNNKLENINSYFLQINPSVELLNNSNTINSIINLIKIILIDLLFFIIFILIGKITYLKNILKNINFNIAKKNKKINLKKECKKKNKIKSYIKKELILLFKNPVFFMQCIFQILIMIISILITLIFTVLDLRLLINESVEKNIIHINFNTICIIVAAIQIVSTFSNISITAISRDGKNAGVLKFIPIDYYKQIIYKSMPQIIINGTFILTVCIFIFTIIPKINLLYLLYIFIIANLLSILNSIIMVVVDLKEPNLDWNAEHEVISNNSKKLYQYVFTIISILLLAYFSKICSGINMNISCLIIIVFLLFILFILNFIINKNKNKLFSKIK